MRISALEQAMGAIEDAVRDHERWKAVAERSKAELEIAHREVEAALCRLHVARNDLEQLVWSREKRAAENSLPAREAQRAASVKVGEIVETAIPCVGKALASKEGE